MKNSSTAPGVILIGMLAVLCCAAPLLITAVGLTAIAAWLSDSAYVLMAAALFAVGASVLWFRQHRRFGAQGYCDPAPLKQRSSHE